MEVMRANHPSLAGNRLGEDGGAEGDDMEAGCEVAAGGVEVGMVEVLSTGGIADEDVREGREEAGVLPEDLGIMYLLLDDDGWAWALAALGGRPGGRLAPLFEPATRALESWEWEGRGRGLSSSSSCSGTSTCSWCCWLLPVEDVLLASAEAPSVTSGDRRGIEAAEEEGCEAKEIVDSSRAASSWLTRLQMLALSDIVW
jgi:hypothetical protein